MDTQILQLELQEDLKKQTISSKALLGTFRLLTDNSRLTGAYQDSSYFPLYYYLGKRINAKNLIEWNFNLGLYSGCFLKGNNTVENIFAFHEKTEEFYSSRIGVSNIKNHYHKKFDICEGTIEEAQEGLGKDSWDVAIVNGEVSYKEQISRLNILWEHISPDGLIVVDYIGSNCGFEDFCRIKNRVPIIFNTRYGIGIIQK
jgi:hypothetical protein